MAATRSTVEVTLSKNHTHAGKPCLPGDKISVAPQIAEFLRNCKVIDKIPGHVRK